jgi:hypothetical protein
MIKYFWGSGQDDNTHDKTSSDNNSKMNNKRKENDDTVITVSYSISEDDDNTSTSSDNENNSTSNSRYTDSDDDDDSDSMNEEDKERFKIKRSIMTVAEHFTCKCDPLLQVYENVLKIPIIENFKDEIFCGLRIVSQTTLNKYNVKSFDDSTHGCLFYNIYCETQPMILTPLSIDSDTFMIKSYLHNPFNYIITRALVERLSIVTKTNPQMLLLMKALVKNIPNILGRYHVSHLECKNKNHLSEQHDKKENEKTCMNDHVIYTKITSKLYKYVESVIGKKEYNENMKWSECDIGLPMPFQLVLFFCGKSEQFRTNKNIKDEPSIMNNTTTTTTTTEYHVQSQTITCSSYIDYDKWVCLPAWCLLLYNENK